MARTARLTEALDSSARLKRENVELRAQIKAALKRRVLDADYEAFVREASQYEAAPPRWLRERAPSKEHQAVPVIHLSDAHFDENVTPGEVNFVNGYGREIATERLRLLGSRAIRLTDEYLTGIHYPGAVLAVSGDMFSGNIHDELRETNADVLTSSLHYWLDQMHALIDMLAQHYGRVYVPCVVGNHPRETRKPQAKHGVRSNFDWLLYALLARDFQRAGDKRVFFYVPDSYDAYWRVYGVRYLQTHGDQFKGGSGIAAQLSPMLIGDARKRERQMAIRRPYDVMTMGHFHYRMCLPTVKMNGTLKGYDEYAYKCNLKYQDPIQSLWLTTPERGITVEAPIYCKAEKEGWERKPAKDRSPAAIFGVSYKQRRPRREA